MADTKIELKSLRPLETREKVVASKEKCPAISRKVKGVRRFCSEVKEGLSEIQCRSRLKKVFTLKTLKNKLPILKWLPQYRLIDLRGDLIAGFTLGLTVIPQSMAYARIAELPTQYGLYSSFICLFVYCFLGTARDANIGTAAVMSLLTAEFTHQIPQLAALLSLICGIAQLVMGLMNIGFIMEFISHTIINSFTTAAALAILFSQVKRWLGLEGVPRDFLSQLYYTAVKLPETKWFDCLMGLVCMIILYLLKKLKALKFVNEPTTICGGILQFVSTARNAITIFFASLVSFLLYHHDLHPITLTGNITSGIPSFQVPQLSIQISINETLSGAESLNMIGIGTVITPLVGLIEVIAIGKAFGKKNGYKVDSTQEFIALGVSNILGSFFSAYPVTGSFSRSAVASQSGVRTTAANIVTGVLVLLALAFLTPIFYFIPTPGLAAVIIMAVTDLIDFSMLGQLWAINKADLVPWCMTFFISLLIGFEYGILIGVAISLLFLIYPWTKTNIKVHPLHEKLTSVDPLNPLKVERESRMVVVEPTFGLLFPGAEVFEEKIFKHISNGDCVIIDFNHIWKLDFSAAMTLRHLAKDFANKNIKYVFINLHENVAPKLKKIKKADSLEDAIEILKRELAEEANEEEKQFEETNAEDKKEEDAGEIVVVVEGKERGDSNAGKGGGDLVEGGLAKDLQTRKEKNQKTAAIIGSAGETKSLLGTANSSTGGIGDV